MLKKILLSLVALIVVFLIVVALQPAHYRVVRTATISAPVADVFASVNDFHRWPAWSPWAKLDPAMKETFAGSPAGTGAVYAWTGNKDVGSGRMTLSDSRPNERVQIQLEFIEPFASTALMEFTFKAVDGQTAITWSMDGENGFMEKAICMFMNMDKMIGGDFEKGLAQLRQETETAGAR
jgi:uncharacterized protein YndB with AHSA1/START domain